MTPERNADFFAGAAMAAASALIVLAMAHHPTGAAHASGGIGGAVHGAMIALLATVLFGFAHFAARRGVDRPLVLAGLVAYGLSAVAHVAAATINGFIVPALASRDAPHDLFLLLWEANQAFARLGLHATSAAFVLFAAHLVLAGRKIDLGLAIAGIAAAAFASGGLASGMLKMNVAGALQIYAAQSAYSFLFGLRLASGAFGKIKAGPV